MSPSSFAYIINVEHEKMLRNLGFSFAVYGYNRRAGSWEIFAATKDVFAARNACKGFVHSSDVKLRNIDSDPDHFMPTMHPDEQEGDWLR